MFHLFVLRAAMRMSGGAYQPRKLSLPLAQDYTRRSKVRTEYVPCAISGGCAVQPVKYHGSAHIVALMKADGFFVIPAGVDSLAAGSDVTMIVL
ncbi:MAG: hypothetical protein ABIA59_11280 [Candidatus Latescibacterota bacterium]